jgi:copper chaperone CopZ
MSKERYDTTRDPIDVMFDLIAADVKIDELYRQIDILKAAIDELQYMLEE